MSWWFLTRKEILELWSTAQQKCFQYVAGVKKVDSLLRTVRKGFQDKTATIIQF